MSTEHNLDLVFSSYQGTLSAPLRAQVQHLAATAQSADANPPLSDQTFIDLAQASNEQLTAVLAHTSGTGSEARLLAAAIASRSNAAEPWTVEVVVDPESRRQRIASRLLEQLEQDLGSLSSVHSWAHGDHPGAQALAQRYSLVRQRDLYKMRRESGEQLPVPALPPQLTLRSFTVGADEHAWLNANAAAFASHPEQGGLTLADLQARMAEAWFDPSGFFLVTDSQQQIQGFHWTKLVEPETADAPRIGEVYVVGVLPTAQGMGLGKILTAVGINYLLEQQVTAVMLYVDADNTAAVKLYKSLGFTVWDVDVMYGPAR